MLTIDLQLDETHTKQLACPALQTRRYPKILESVSLQMLTKYIECAKVYIASRTLICLCSPSWAKVVLGVVALAQKSQMAPSTVTP